MDYKKLFIQAGKILWEHKIIPVFFVGLFSIPTIIPLSLMGILIFTFDPSQAEGLFRSIGYLIDIGGSYDGSFGPFIGVALVLLLTAFSYPCLMLGSIIASKGVSLAENSGAGEINFMIFWQACLKYLGRVWVIFFVVGVAVLALMQIFILPAAIIGILSFLPFIYAFAGLTWFLVPVFLLGRTLVEMLVAAIVIDNLGIREAIGHIWQMTKTCFFSLAFITMLLVAGEIFIDQAMSLSLNIVHKATLFFVSLPSEQSVAQTSGAVYKIMFGISALIVSITAVAQGLITAYHLSVTTLTYLNLKAKNISTEIQPETVENSVIR